MNARNSTAFRMAVLSGMTLMLVVAATLQYKWATQLSAATEVRIGSNLRSLMTSWHRDFYDELSAICIGLQVGPDSGAHDAWNDYLQRYAVWKQEGAYSQFAEGVYADPDVVREIYLWRTSVSREPRLLRLDPDYKILALVKMPQELQTLLARLQANSANLTVATRAWAFHNLAESEHAAGNNRAPGAALRRNALAGWQLDESIPALVHPVVHHSNPFNSQTPIDRAAVDWLVVVLDSDIIQNRILPELARHYFGGPGGLEYELAVLTTGDDARIIYSSSAGVIAENVAGFDSAMNIFGPSSRNAPGPVSYDGRRASNLQDENWRNFSAPVWFPVIQYTAQDRSWVLMVRHRTGPVAKIARSLWYRDLAIGSVVLLLLAANMGLVVFSSYRAQRLAKVQMEFVASVTHELRTPLSTIFAASENIRDGFVEGQKNLKFYGTILTSQARRLMDLVDRILLFASTRAGKKKYYVVPLRVSGILAAVRKNMAEEIAGGGCTFEEHIDPALPEVLADLSGVCACLQNLIANAVKYGGKERWVGLSVTCHRAENPGVEVRFSVQDHGLGISASDLQNIVVPFYRSPSVVAAQIYGTGLGLALTKRIAEDLGGRISVVSELGVGSTFTLHLRAVEAQELAEQTQFQQAINTTGQ